MNSSKRWPCKKRIFFLPLSSIISSVQVTPSKCETISAGPSWFPLIQVISISSDSLRSSERMPVLLLQAAEVDRIEHVTVEDEPRGGQVAATDGRQKMCQVP